MFKTELFGKKKRLTYIPIKSMPIKYIPIKSMPPPRSSTKKYVPTQKID